MNYLADVAKYFKLGGGIEYLETCEHRIRSFYLGKFEMEMSLQQQEQGSGD